MSQDNSDISMMKPIEYFQLYWMDYVSTLVKKEYDEVHLDSPRMLLNEIISEIQYNQFKNKENIDYFRNTLSGWNKQDAVFKSIAGTEVTKALSHYFNPQKQKMLMEVCYHIIKKLDENNYVDKLIDGLQHCIEANAELTLDNRKIIRQYVQLIVAEFVSKGYDLQDIRETSYDIPGVIRVAGGDVVQAPDAFIDINKAQYPSKEAYFEAVRERIKRRDIAEMIQPIRDWYHREPKDAYLLMSISSIKGVKEVCIGDVIIYSPYVRKFVNTKYRCSLEEESDYPKLCAAIPVKYIGIQTAIKDAKQKMDKVFELLSVYYYTDKVFEYDLGHYYVVKDGIEIAESMSNSETGIRNTNDFYRHAMALNMDVLNNDHEAIDTLYHKINQHPDESTASRLNNALHWCRKANAARTNEEKLLDSWFALEGLLKVSDDVMGCIVDKTDNKIDYIHKVTTVAWGQRLYRDKCLHVYFDMWMRIHSIKILNLPEDIMKRSGLDAQEGEAYKMSDFIRCAEELTRYANDELLKDQLWEVSHYCKTVDNYKKEIARLRNNLLNIYRYRNLIVHNAVLPTESTEYYACLIYKICREVTGSVIRKCTESNSTIEQALLQLAIDYQSFESELEANKAI